MKLKGKLFFSFAVVLVIIIALGIASIFMLDSLYNEAVNVGVKNAPLGDAAMEIKLTATTAHLWFEEIMGGDDTEDINNVWSLLDDTLWYADAILHGGSNEEGTFYASEDPEVIGIVKTVRTSVENFIQSAHTRYDSRTSGSVTGSGIDQAFDGTYEDLQAALVGFSEGVLEAGDVQNVYRIGEARYYLANGHLFLEEYLSGDEEVQFEDIASDFNRSMELALAAAENDPQLQQDYTEFLNIVNQRNEMSLASMAAGGDADARFDEEFESFLTLADEAEELIHHHMDAGVEKMERTSQISQYVTIAVLIFAVIAAFLAGFLLYRSVNRDLGADPSVINDIAGKIAEGDLRLSFDEENMVGVYESMQKMTGKLKEIISSVQTSADNVGTGSQEMSSSAEELSQGSTQQASSV